MTADVPAKLIDLAIDINADHRQACALLKARLRHAIKAGRHFHEAKASVPHGEALARWRLHGVEVRMGRRVSRAIWLGRELIIERPNDKNLAD